MKITDVSSSSSEAAASKQDAVEKDERPKRTLLQRYNIPVEHLDFGYVEKCSNAKEVERILRILRSGEEGMFPELQAFVEKRLHQLNPNSRVLRVETPAIRTKDLGKEERDEILKGLEEWAVAKNSLSVPASRDIFNGSGDGADDLESLMKNFPLPVRGSSGQAAAEASMQIPASSIKKNKKPNESRIKSWEYDKWDKYDVDVELTKLDVVDMKTAEWEKREKPKLMEEQKRIEQLMKSEEPMDSDKNRSSKPPDTNTSKVPPNPSNSSSLTLGKSKTPAKNKDTNSYKGSPEMPSFIEEVNEDDEVGEVVNARPLFSAKGYKKTTVLIDDLNLPM